VLTRSSHPSPLLAVHGLGKQAHVLILGQSEHSKAHGEKLLREIVYDGCHKVELAKEDPSRKRLRVEDVLTVPIMASPDQSPTFFEVQADPAASSWRAGIDHSCEEIDLSKEVMELCTKEFESMELAVRDRHGCKQLVATKALKEGQRVGKVSSLLFSTKGVMRDFLNTGGNVALMGAPLLEAGNLETSDLLEGVKLNSVHAVLVGAARLLTDHRHAKVKFPNVEIICCPELGPNDGFIQFRVKTHNQCGILADKALVVDFGPGWQLSTAGTSDAAKRFKGSLDSFWGEVAAEDDGIHADCESDIVEPSPKKARVTDAAALRATTQEQAQPTDTNPSPDPKPSPDPTSVILAAGEHLVGVHDGITPLLDSKHAINLWCDSAGAISAVSQQYLISISAVSH
jgi:hypothetical protein